MSRTAVSALRASLLGWPLLILCACSPEPVVWPGGGTLPAGPELLAPGFINTGLVTRDVAMSPDGGEVYFCQATAGYGQGAILVTRRGSDGWSDPEVVSFSGHRDWVDLEPCLSPDGRRLFFYSSRPVTAEGEAAQDIWVVDRNGDGWGEPRNLGSPVNSEAPEYFPSVTADGTLYFCRADPATRVHTLFRARRQGDGYAEPERLPDAANAGRNRFNAWVDPDESRMIIPVAGHPDNLGGVDYWLALRDSNDVWTGPLNLGPVVNDGAGGSWSPYVSPDRSAFFFMSSRTSGPVPVWPEPWSGLQGRHRRPGAGRAAIYWMDAAFLDRLAAGEMAPADSVALSPTTAAGHDPGPTWPVLSGPYLGQTPPGTEPEIFAPGLVSTGLTERDIHISRDGTEIRYGLMDLGLVTVLETRLEAGRWTEPVTVGFHTDSDFACFEPAFSADGQTVLFLANVAAPGQTQGRGWANQNIFRSVRRDGLWSSPEALAAPVTSDRAEYFPSLALDGTLYFSRFPVKTRPATPPSGGPNRTATVLRSRCVCRTPLTAAPTCTTPSWPRTSPSSSCAWGAMRRIWGGPTTGSVTGTPPAVGRPPKIWGRSSTVRTREPVRRSSLRTGPISFSAPPAPCRGPLRCPTATYDRICTVCIRNRGRAAVTCGGSPRRCCQGPDTWRNDSELRQSLNENGFYCQKK